MALEYTILHEDDGRDTVQFRPFHPGMYQLFLVHNGSLVKGGALNYNCSKPGDCFSSAIFAPNRDAYDEELKQAFGCISEIFQVRPEDLQSTLDEASSVTKPDKYRQGTTFHQQDNRVNIITNSINSDDSRLIDSFELEDASQWKVKLENDHMMDMQLSSIKNNVFENKNSACPEMSQNIAIKEEPEEISQIIAIKEEAEEPRLAESGINVPNSGSFSLKQLHCSNLLDSDTINHTLSNIDDQVSDSNTEIKYECEEENPSDIESADQEQFPESSDVNDPPSNFRTSKSVVREQPNRHKNQISNFSNSKNIASKQPKRHKRRYDVAEKLQIVALVEGQGGHRNKISKDLNIPSLTIVNWMKRKTELQKQYQSALNHTISKNKRTDLYPTSEGSILSLNTTMDDIPEKLPTQEILITENILNDSKDSSVMMDVAALPDDNADELAPLVRTTRAKRIKKKPVSTTIINHPITFLKCPEGDCNYSTTYKSSLKRHKESHHDHKRYHCTHCNHSYRHHFELSTHIKYVHNGEPLLCQVCGERYTSRSGLWRHLKSAHSEERKYNCSLCDKKFICKSDCTGHINMHLENEPYSCQKCHKRFSYKNSMLRHTKSCNDESVVQCEECSLKFNSLANLKDHVNAKHGIAKIYRCSCGKEYPWRSSYHRHRRSCNHESTTKHE